MVATPCGTAWFWSPTLLTCLLLTSAAAGVETGPQAEVDLREQALVLQREAERTAQAVTLHELLEAAGSLQEAAKPVLQQAPTAPGPRGLRGTRTEAVESEGASDDDSAGDPSSRAARRRLLQASLRLQARLITRTAADLHTVLERQHLNRERLEAAESRSQRARAAAVDSERQLQTSEQELVQAVAKMQESCSAWNATASARVELAMEAAAEGQRLGQLGRSREVARQHRTSLAIASLQAHISLASASAAALLATEAAANKTSELHANVEQLDALHAEVTQAKAKAATAAAAEPAVAAIHDDAVDRSLLAVRQQSETVAQIAEVANVVNDEAQRASSDRDLAYDMLRQIEERISLTNNDYLALASEEASVRNNHEQLRSAEQDAISRIADLQRTCEQSRAQQEELLETSKRLQQASAAARSTGTQASNAFALLRRQFEESQAETRPLRTRLEGLVEEVARLQCKLNTLQAGGSAGAVTSSRESGVLPAGSARLPPLATLTAVVVALVAAAAYCGATAKTRL